MDNVAKMDAEIIFWLCIVGIICCAFYLLYLLLKKEHNHSERMKDPEYRKQYNKAMRDLFTVTHLCK